MLEIKDNTYKGTRILVGNEKRALINSMVRILLEEGFEEISIPVIQFRDTFKDKVGIENTSMMFSVKDNSPDRDLVLAPEYTAVIQQLAKKRYKYQKNVKLFYIQECFRGEQPQQGRYRQFTQLGVEILNHTAGKPQDYIVSIASKLLEEIFDWNDFYLNRDVTRGLDYYKAGKGFEISCDKLGAQKQVCGGGEYEGGIGFALGIDRLLLLTQDK